MRLQRVRPGWHNGRTLRTTGGVLRRVRKRWLGRDRCCIDPVVLGHESGGAGALVHAHGFDPWGG